MNTVSLVLPLVLASLAYAIVCPTDFVAIKGNCFYFEVNEPPTSWQFSRLRCQNIAVTNGTVDLATVENCNLFKELFQYMYAQYTDVDFWIGGSDEETPGIWHWVNGVLMPVGHPYWNPGQPSYSSDHCSYISGSTGLFSGESCTDDYYAKYGMCQIFPV